MSKAINVHPYLFAKSLAGLIVFIVLSNFICHDHTTKPEPPVLPLSCDSAARMLTHDWLEANIFAEQKDLLRSPANRTVIANANDFITLETIFTSVGVQNLRQRLVEKKIKSDPVCRVDSSIEKPALPDSLIFKPVKDAILQFLQ